MLSLPFNFTLWKKTGTTGYNVPTFDTPVTIRGRLEYKETILRDRRDEENHVSTSVVWTSSILAEKGDYLAEGGFTELNPLEVSEAREILSIQKTRGMSGKVLAGWYL